MQEHTKKTPLRGLREHKSMVTKSPVTGVIQIPQKS